ncbi:hypothetical protein GCM10023144_45520 [Pigmentiphaga soli]|uniref:Lipoprotein n=1 Tax=Pigmentiphaga soli TaxID=1007095 RepID=A0ABP8HR20_9BURK
MSPTRPFIPSTTPPSRAGGRRLCAAAALLLPALLSGCDYVGLQSVAQIEARKEAEGKAIGGACRQAGRALEDCFAFNPQVSKASIFSGWREMNDYMTQNNLGVVHPEVVPALPASRARPAPSAAVDDPLPRTMARPATLPLR